jgi:hypothetical protein
MLLPFTEQQCFFIAIFVFLVLGFQRGWRRELVSLVFILLASFIVRPDTSNAVGSVLTRLPGVIGGASASSSTSQQPVAQVTSLWGGPFWSLVIFAGLVLLGYYVGNKVFPQPTTPQERFIGIVPAVISGAFVLEYLSNYFKETAGSASLKVNMQSPDPLNYIAVIFVIAVIALVVALIASQRKPVKK